MTGRTKYPHHALAGILCACIDFSMCQVYSSEHMPLIFHHDDSVLYSEFENNSTLRMKAYLKYLLTTMLIYLAFLLQIKLVAEHSVFVDADLSPEGMLACIIYRHATCGFLCI